MVAMVDPFALDMVVGVSYSGLDIKEVSCSGFDTMAVSCLGLDIGVGPCSDFKGKVGVVGRMEVVSWVAAKGSY